VLGIVVVLHAHDPTHSYLYNIAVFPKCSCCSWTAWPWTWGNYTPLCCREVFILVHSLKSQKAWTLILGLFFHGFLNLHRGFQSLCGACCWHVFVLHNIKLLTFLICDGVEKRIYFCRWEHWFCHRAGCFWSISCQSILMCIEYKLLVQTPVTLHLECAILITFIFVSIVFCKMHRV